MNKKIPFFGAVFVSLIVLGPLWIRSKGGVANALNIPPTVTIRQSSAAFTFKAVTENTWGSYFVVDSPLVSRATPTHEAFGFLTPANAFTATATDSTGQRWTLRWDIRSRGSFVDYRKAFGSDDAIYIWKPESCPPDVKWYDVTLRSKWGQSATWRVSHLQAARQYGQSDSVQPSFTFNGMTISAVAERFFATNSSPRSVTLHPRFTVNGRPADGQDWRVRLVDCTREWENPARISSFDMAWKPIKPTKHGIPLDPWPYGDEHYPQRNHYVRATGAFALFRQGRIQQTVPFTLKVPIVFRTYKPTPTPNQPQRD